MSDTVKKYRIQQKTETGYLTLHPETSADLVLDTASKVMMTSAERTKLEGITADATVNKIDAIKVGADGTPVTIDNKTAILPAYDAGAQVNVIESIALGGTGTEVTVSGKVATLPVETGAQVNKIEVVKLGESAVEISSNDKSVSLPAYEANAQVNRIEKIKINNAEQTITNKVVNLPAYEAGAQVNKIENVNYAGAALTITDKTISIPVDSAVSSSSIYAVSGSAVYTELSKKVDKVEGSSLMTSAEHTKLAGIAENANVNVIETVKVNGEALTPDSKAVDVKVPTTVAELTDKADYLTVLTAANTYATKQQLTDLIGGAPEALNTLGEIAAWIGNDTTGASAMLADINGLKAEVYGAGEGASAANSRIDVIETKVNGMATDGTVQDIQTRVTALEGSVGTDDTSGLRKAVKDNTASIEDHDTRISANTTAIGKISSITPGSWTGDSDYLTYTQFTSKGGSGLLKTVTDQGAWIDVLKDVVFDESANVYTNLVQRNTNSIAANATKLSALTTELFGKDDTTGYSRIDTAESNISTVINEVWGANTTTGDSRIDRLESSIGMTDTAEGTLRSRITALETTVNNETDGVRANAGAIDTLQGYFTDGVANNADKLDNHDSTYFATATDLNTVKGYFTNGKANTAANADSAAVAAKLSSAKTISMTGDVAWSVSFDGSDNVTADGTLATTGVTAGTYTAVTVDAKGRVTNGAASIEVGTTVNGDASGNLAVGGLFFRLIEE